MTSPRIVWAPEPIRIHRWTEVLACGLGYRKGNASCLLTSSPLSAVHDYAHDPCLQLRTTFEPADAIEHAEPGLLHDFLGDGAAPYISQGDPKHRRLIALDELRECVLITGAQRENQLQFVGW